MDTFDLLKQLVSEKTDADVLLSSTMKDLKLDSIDLVDLLVTLEEKLKIRFRDEEMLQLKTVEDVVRLVDAKRHI
ncbi:MAG: acyl carrier protein [Erysipelotrichaceae bacterium]|nr:acyl carrier protein [Erysipelotrichaceae bacterium]